MRAASYDAFGGPISIEEVAVPTIGDRDARIEVRATGVCRSDWHGWRGHDPDVAAFPHVPGHEFAGVVSAVGGEVNRWSPGDRVVAPFIAGCGRCEQCSSGNSQVCPDQTQPGFTHWGSFAEEVVVHHADANLVALPPTIDFETAAPLGCRFSTAYRALVDQGGLAAGERVAVYGCGGVGLSAVMIAAALGADVVGIDPRADARSLASSIGASVVLGPDEARRRLPDLAGGPHLTVDAVGSPEVVGAAVTSLRPLGRHVQVGLLPHPAAFESVPAGRLIGKELSILGSHGMSTAGLAALVGMVETGVLEPGRLIGRTVDLAAGIDVLTRLDDEPPLGFTVINAL